MRAHGLIPKLCSKRAAEKNTPITLDKANIACAHEKNARPPWPPKEFNGISRQNTTSNHHHHRSGGCSSVTCVFLCASHWWLHLHGALLNSIMVMPPLGLMFQSIWNIAFARRYGRVFATMLHVQTAAETSSVVSADVWTSTRA